jgi:heme/copper-type cytochrome/quinol oxidase subunit 3
VGSSRREQGRDRRSLEITYVVVSSVTVFAVLAGAYTFLLSRTGPAWHDQVSSLGRPGAVLVIALLLLRAGHLLGRLERRLRR